jgi:hypothetical protein
VLIQPVAADAIASAAKYAVPLETGGILVGHHEDDMLVITHAITVPAMSASGSRYTRDDLSANAALSDYLLTASPAILPVMWVNGTATPHVPASAPSISGRFARLQTT